MRVLLAAGLLKDSFVQPILHLLHGSREDSIAEVEIDDDIAQGGNE